MKNALLFKDREGKEDNFLSVSLTNEYGFIRIVVSDKTNKTMAVLLERDLRYLAETFNRFADYTTDQE